MLAASAVVDSRRETFSSLNLLSNEVAPYGLEVLGLAWLYHDTYLMASSLDTTSSSFRLASSSSLT